MADITYLTIDEFLQQAEDQSTPISYRTLRYYSSLGLLPPATMLKDKGGRARGHYPSTALLRLALIYELQQRDINLQQIQSALQYITAGYDSDKAEEEKQLRRWLDQLRQQGVLPLLLELNPTVGDQVREQLVEMLLAADITPLSSSLRDIRLTANTNSGQPLSRYFYLAPDGLEIENVFFWDLSRLVDLLNSAASLDRHLKSITLAQARAWLHGRTNWSQQDFFMAKYEGRPVACIGLHRPWPERLVANAQVFGPIVHPEFRGLGLGEQLLKRMLSHAASLELESIEIETSPELRDGAIDCNAADLQQLGFAPKGSGERLQLQTATPNLEPAPGTALPLTAQPGKNFVSSFFKLGSKADSLISQAVFDSTMPVWGALTSAHRPVAIAWLNSLDRQIILRTNQEASSHLIASLLAKVVETARLKGMSQLELFVPTEGPVGEAVRLFRTKEPEHKHVFIKQLKEPST